MTLTIRQLGRLPYQTVWDNMRQLTHSRTTSTPDELWLLEHPPIYTQGQAGKAEHLLNPGHIPVIQTDRGGQVTYHGPGQLVGYVMLDLRRYNIGVRTLVCRLEKTLVDLLAELGINAALRPSAPGVYVGEAKIASIGLRVRQGCSYHGIALNVNMDLSPFSGINPCGFAQLPMTQIATYHPDITIEKVSPLFVKYFIQHFSQ